MNRILAKRYAFCDFSSIVGFPNQVPSRDEWENSLPRFHGEEWEVPAEHLLDFHEFIDRLEIVHEDVKIKLFKFSLEGIGLDWCRSLPDANINSLAGFHSAFHEFCKDHFSVDLLFPDCCHEFNLSKSELQGEYAAEENTLHHNPEYVDDVAAYAMGTLQFSDVKTQGNSIKNGEEDKDLKGPDQQPALYVSPAKIPQPTFSRETNELSQQQIKEVFFHDFEDPIANFLDSFNSMNDKIFMSEEGYLYHRLKPFFCTIWYSLLIGSRLNMMPVNHFLTWLHWKSSFT